MKTEITVTYKGLISLTGWKPIKEIIERAGVKAGLYWGRNFLGKHFTKAGAREYGYEPRKNEGARPGGKRFARVAGPAEKRAGEILPLVYSGDLQGQVRTAYKVTAVATRKDTHVRVTFPRAKGLNRLARKYRQDIRRVSDAEMVVLVKLINLELQQGLQGISGSRRCRVA